MIELHTLGDALIRVGEKDVRPTSPSMFAALLYLGLERGRRVPRTALQELLFPNVDERSGAHSLRQLLYKLRQLGTPLEMTVSDLAIPAGAILDDVHSVADSLSANSAVASLDVLPGYAPSFSDSFNDWLETARDRRRAELRRILLRMIDGSRAALRWSDVGAFARHLLRIDPLNEEGTLALAESSAMAGAKTEAVGILTEYQRETGRTDLRLAPAMLRKRISEYPVDRIRVSSSPFFGRAADIVAIREPVRRAAHGNPCMVFVEGDPGCGKTRLLNEVAASSALDGVELVQLKCLPQHKTRPLGAFIELVPLLLRLPGALGIAPDSLARLNSLVKHAEDEVDRVSGPTDGHTRAEALAASIRDLVDAVSGEAPLVLFIDDLHNVDAHSARLFGELVQNARSSIAIIGGARSLGALRESLPDERLLVRRLAPLDFDAMRSIASHLLPKDAPAGMSAWAATTAAGNPLYLELICQHYWQTRVPFTVPPTLVATIRSRIEALPDAARRLLELCAVLSTRASITTLREVLRLDAMNLLGSVRLLEDGGYVRYEKDAVRLSHDLMSDGVVSLIPPASLCLLHSTVAEYLQRRYLEARDASLLWDTAEHWRRSGESESAVRFLIRCARHAVSIGRVEEATEIMSQAYEIASTPGLRTSVRLEQMHVAKAAGDSKGTLQFAAECASEWQNPHRHNEHELVAIEADWHVTLDVPRVQRLLSCVSSASASVEHRADAALLLLRVAHETGDAELGRTAYFSVKDLLSENSSRYSDRLLPIIYHTSFGDADRALVMARRLAKTVDSITPLVDEFRAVINVCMALQILGALEEARQLARQYYERCNAMGLTLWPISFCTALTGSYSLESRWDEMQKWYDRIDHSRVGRLSVAMARGIHSAGFELALERHDLPEALRCLHLLDSITLSDSLRGRAFTFSAYVRFRQVDPSYRSDAAEIEEMLTLYRNTGTLISADTVVIALGEALVRERRGAEAKALITDYVTNVRRERVPMCSLLTRVLDHAEESIASASA